MSYALQSLNRGNQFIQSRENSLLVSLGFEQDSSVYLFPYYVIEQIEFSFDPFRGGETIISIRCAEPSVQSSMSNLDLDLRAARDLSVDELIKIVYNKLQQRSDF